MLRLCAFFLLAFCSACSALAQPLQLGVPPAGSFHRIENHLATFVEMMGEPIGRKVVLRTRSNFHTFREALKKEEFELALAQPFEYIKLKQQNTTYFPIARFSNPFTASVYVKDDSIRSLDDLRGETIAFPARSATATILGLRAIRNDGFEDNDFEFQFYSEHESCIQALLIGSAKACVTVKELMNLYVRGRIDLPKSIFESESIPNATLLMRGDIKRYQRALQDFLIAYNNTEAGKDFFSLYDNDRFELTDDFDFEVVENIFSEIGVAD